jgi:hypothetical protein
VVSDCEHCCPILICIWGQFCLSLCVIVIGVALRVESLREHHLLEQDNCRHSVVKCQFVLIKLGKHSANIQMSISLNLWSLQLSLDGERLLQEVKCRSHFADPAVVARHIVEGHCLAEFVIFTELLTLFKEVER